MSDFRDEEGQGELFGADELIRLDQGAIDKATKELQRIINNLVGGIVDRVMDQGYQVLTASVKQQNLESQIQAMADESDMEYQDILMELDEYYEVTLDLSQVATKTLVHALMRSMPHPVDPEDLAEMAKSAWED